MEYKSKKYCFLSDDSIINDADYGLESLAMLYSPYQSWNEDLIFVETGLDKGTIFANLDKPFYGYKTKCGSITCKPLHTRPCDIQRAKKECR